MGIRARGPTARFRGRPVRGSVIQLGARFLGSCRDLHLESSRSILPGIPPGLQVLILAQFSANRTLDRGNPGLQKLRKDFEGRGVLMNLATTVPRNPGRRLERIPAEA